jgi:hypothetical protein
MTTSLRHGAVKLASAVAAACLITGCNPGKDKATAEAAVVTFHQRFERSDFAGIYADSHPELKKAKPEKEFVALLDSIHRKLGPLVDSQQAQWRVNRHNADTNISLVYKTKFTEGDSVESFVYRMDGAKARLLSYKVNSNALVLK